MRREKLYLADLVEAADAIQIFLAGVTQEAFLADDLIRSAVLQKLMIIGEAAAKLPENLRGRHAEIPWADIIAFRNVAVHAYFTMQWPVVWTVATTQVPELRSQVAAILDAEYGADNGAD